MENAWDVAGGLRVSSGTWAPEANILKLLVLDTLVRHLRKPCLPPSSPVRGVSPPSPEPPSCSPCSPLSLPSDPSCRQGQQHVSPDWFCLKSTMSGHLLYTYLSGKHLKLFACQAVSPAVFLVKPLLTRVMCSFCGRSCAGPPVHGASRDSSPGRGCRPRQ